MQGRAREGEWRGRGGVELAESRYTLPGKTLGVLPILIGTGGEGRAREGEWRGRGGVEPAGSGYTLPRESLELLQDSVYGTGGDGRAGEGGWRGGEGGVLPVGSGYILTSGVRRVVAVEAGEVGEDVEEDVV